MNPTEIRDQNEIKLELVQESSAVEPLFTKPVVLNILHFIYLVKSNKLQLHRLKVRRTQVELNRAINISESPTISKRLRMG